MEEHILYQSIKIEQNYLENQKKVGCLLIQRAHVSLRYRELTTNYCMNWYTGKTEKTLDMSEENVGAKPKLLL